MNKLFTKIASLTLGLALAAGAGAFFGSRAAEGVNAAEALSQKCDFTSKASSNSGYGSTWTYDTDYTVFGGANNNGGWAYVSFGAKCAKGESSKVTNAYVMTNDPISNDLTKVTFTVTTARKQGGTVNISLTVASDSSFSSVVDTVDLGTVSQNTNATHTIVPSSGTSWGANRYYRLNIDCTNTTTTNGMISLTEISYYYESSIPVGTLSIVPFSSNVLTTGDSGTLTYSFEPASGDSATITSATWSSSDATVLSVSGSTYTAEAPGTFRVSLSAQDSNGQNYNIDGSFCFVSNALEFAVGDDVAIVSKVKDSIPAYELTGVNTTNNYGIAKEISTDPEGSYRLTVGTGELSGSFTFSNEGNYLTWNSGNSLTTSTSISENSSWYVISFGDYLSILNGKDSGRDLLMNQNVTSGTPNPRFACYSGNTTYPRSNIVVLPEPVNPRGTVAITSPTDTLIKLGDTGPLSYSWTPNVEAPDATISSIVWTSSDSSVISVDNSSYTYEAIAPGSAKLSYEATDSLGEVYTGSTNFITVKNKVSGSYVKYTSVKVGDTVALVCDNETIKTQLSEIVKMGSNYAGDYAFYETAPASLYDLTLVAGTAENSFAFVTSDSKYLVWESGNTLNVAEEITANSSWTVNFDESGNALISNVADSTRLIKWNHTTPRFATYTSEQTPIQLYGPSQEIVISENGLAFINNLLSYTCDEDGKTAPSTSAWSDLNTQYNATGDDLIPTEDKDLFKSITAVEHASPVTTREKVEQAMAKYDYIVGKYNKTLGQTEDYPDFIERDPAPLKNIRTETIGYNSTNTAIIVVSVIAIVSVSSIGVLLVLKRRKNHI